MEEVNEIDPALKPEVSICMITYNHQHFIADAIEGVLLQNASFSFELVIGIDKSSDDTLTICLNYQKRHPDKIRLILNDSNIGMMPNFIQTLKLSKGKYVAICEGDDYWTDPLKLQKQVDILDANPDYAICVHRISVLRDNKHYPFNFTSGYEGTYTIEDLAKGNIISTPSVVFRNGLIKYFPSWFGISPVGDYVLYMLIARNGKIAYLPEIMATYREHAGGIWSTQPRSNILEKWILVLSFLLREEFNEKVTDLIKTQKRNISTDYLSSILEADPQLFHAKLQELTDGDAALGREWLLNHFPAYITQLKNSKTFVLAKRISKLASIRRNGYLLRLLQRQKNPNK